MKNSHLVYGPWYSVNLIFKRRLLRWILKRRSNRRPARFAVLPNDHVSNEIIISGLYEERFLVTLFEYWFKPFLSEFSNGIALDIGANIGNHTEYFSRHFKKVYAFEPNPIALALLECNMKLNECENVEVLPFGLGNELGDFDFIVNKHGNLGGSGFDYSGQTPIGSTNIKCHIKRGDQYFSENEIEEPIRLIKLDIEGGELHALHGLAKTIQKHHPLIIFESNNGVDGNKVITYLRSCGYQNFSALSDSSTRYGRLGKLFNILLFGEHIEIFNLKLVGDTSYSMLIASVDRIG